MTTRFPGADWRPTPTNFTHDDVVRPPNGMVLHIAQGTYEGTIGWEHNPAAEVSSYFVVGPDGAIAQLVDLADKAWTESAGNEHWIGVEFAGFVPQALLPDQIDAAARLLAWLHTEHGVPLVATDDVNGHGLGWHGMGGNSWGGHQGCPGPAIVAQRPTIIAKAQQLVGAPVPAPTPPTAPTQSVTAPYKDGVTMRTEITMTLGSKGEGHVPVKGVKAADVSSLIPITTDPPSHGYASIPRVGLTIGADADAEVVVEGGTPASRFTVRVVHQ